MDTHLTLTVSVVARSATRSTSYNVRDMVRVLEGVGLSPVREGMLLVASHVCASKEEALSLRKQVETSIKRVHRNASYRFVFE